MGVGSWIFVSHSNKDFHAVRMLRNALEERGHFPLLFFLKSVSDEAELDSLLRREIEARDFFLLCDSENARSSRYVQEEVGFIKSLGTKVYETVDVSADWDLQLAKIEELSRRATVFLSFVGEDSGVAEQIAAGLEARDFKVLNLHPDLHASIDSCYRLCK
jgi:TIR domain